MSNPLAALRLDPAACLTSLFAGSPDCMKVLDLDARLLTINRAGLLLLGHRDAAELLGRSWIDYLPQEARRSAGALFSQAKAGRPAKRALPLATANGLRRCEVSAYGLRDVDDAVVAVLVVTRDVTPLIEARERAESRERAAEQASRAKSVFLANMSHEIRTPLHGILGMTQVMARDLLTDAQRERLAILRRSGDVLLAVLDDILDLSRIEAGRMPINPRDFDLEQTLASACAPFAALAADKGLELTATVTEGASGRWRGDDVRLHQILSNLVSNAVKFTDAGTVTVRADARPGELTVAVQDQGPGLDEAQLDQLFQPFHQADNGVDRRHGGVGLGLSICRRLAILMGGDVTVQTAPGHGARFVVALPLERPAALPEPAAPEARPAFGGRRLSILAAEDNLTNQLILTAMLEPLDAELVVVGDGAQAVAAYTARIPDIVLMDIQMPVRNGLDATRDIRRHEGEQGLAPTPILALSANVMPHQTAEYEAAGIDAVLPKPLDATALFHAIAELLQR